LAEVEPYFCST